jgi:hypothetical protein
VKASRNMAKVGSKGRDGEDYYKWRPTSGHKSSYKWFPTRGRSSPVWKWRHNVRQSQRNLQKQWLTVLYYRKESGMLFINLVW